MGNGPLADPRLQEIESRLNAGRFDEAQRLLGTILNLPDAEMASAYFATRLLFQRGRLDQGGVIQRLRELLASAPEFPEAARMLAAAEAGVLAPDPEVFRRVTAAPDTTDPESPASAPLKATSPREIPRAPLVPRFTPRPGTPSYAPSTPLAPRPDDASELPPIPSLNQTIRGVGEPLALDWPPPGPAERAPLGAPGATAGAIPLIPSLEMPAINAISTLTASEPEALAEARIGKPLDPRGGAYSMRSPSAEMVETLPALERGHVRAPQAAQVATNVSPWGAEEASFAQGDPTACLERLTRKAGDALRTQSRHGGAERWQALGTQAARLLTELPVFRHFAPYDCSVFSVDRLEAALSLVFGDGRPRGALDEATIVLLGAYVGESFRQAVGAEWHGTVSSPFSASVQGIGLAVHPCERVRERLERGVALRIEPPHSLHPGADPLGNSVPLSLVPPAPWDPAPFPSWTHFNALGRGLRESVVGVYCERTLDSPLDFSLERAVAIDRYVALLAPPQAPPDPEAVWARRAALLLGAYLGEVLVDAVGARWENDAPPKSLEDYRLVLPHGAVATPVVRVRERLAGRRPAPLSEYITRLASGRNSISA